MISLTDGTINIEPLSQEDLNLIQDIESSSGEGMNDEIIPEGSGEMNEEQDTSGEEVKEIRITVQTLSGDEKEIIIRYTE